VTTAAYLRDEAGPGAAAAGGAQLSVLVDRPQGCASLVDGALQCLVQRRLLADDARGVSEPLNETDAGIDHATGARRGDGVVAAGSHWLLLSPTAAAADDNEGAMRDLRVQMDRTYQPLQVFVGRTQAQAQRRLPENEPEAAPAEAHEDSQPQHVHGDEAEAEAEGLRGGRRRSPHALPLPAPAGASPLGAPLPPNVHLATLERWSKVCVCVCVCGRARLMIHVYPAGHED
jgi:hypothetical protein